jgi:peptide/nickel transport system ATP-binding protein
MSNVDTYGADTPRAGERAGLDIKNLSVSFSMYGQGLRKKDLQVITDLSLTVRQGEILAVAGSSGSGKSLLAHAIFGILPKNATVTGDMRWFGEELTPQMQAKLRGRELALVPQSVAFLDPLKRVGKQVSRDQKATRSVFARYGLDEGTARLYPFQLSGGMARRVLVATAVVGGDKETPAGEGPAGEGPAGEAPAGEGPTGEGPAGYAPAGETPPEKTAPKRPPQPKQQANLQHLPKVIVADEPTPGLSTELANTAMGHFRELADAGVAILLITHDLTLALQYADRIAVFYAGTTVETARATDFADERLLRHPYSKALWRAMPENGFRATPGSQPYAGHLPPGCPYAPRCELKRPQCDDAMPAARSVRGGEVCCLYAT